MPFYALYGFQKRTLAHIHHRKIFFAPSIFYVPMRLKIKKHAQELFKTFTQKLIQE